MMPLQFILFWLLIAMAGAPQQATVDCPAGVPPQTTCSAGRDENGAYYLIAMPKDWNGGLIVHASGGPRLTPRSATFSNQDLTRFGMMVKEGYAWVASSYRRPGYGVRMAAADTDNARRAFIAKYGKPKLTIVHGQSQGGNIAAKLIELYTFDPDGTRNYDGALLTSGVLGGGSHGYDYRVDLRVVYEYYCHNNPRPDEPQYPLWMGLAPNAVLGAADLKARVEACTGVNLPAAQRSPQQQTNLTNILAVVRIPEKSLVQHVGWATYLFANMVGELLGGRNPFGNAGVQYRGSSDDAALNRGVARFSPDPQAVAELAYDSDLTGQIAIPVVTVHAIDDPTAFVEHESRYREAVERAGNGRLLVQTFTREAVHSKLNEPEYPAALHALRDWIVNGVRPTPSAIAAACPEYQKIYGEHCLFDPSYRPAPYGSRVYPR